MTTIVDAVKATLDKTPPELAADIMEQGIILTVGGAMLYGLDARLAAETGMTFQIADNPLQSVAIGCGQCLEEFDVLNGVLISSMSR
jgi:rod shape-determining protein MreB